MGTILLIEDNERMAQVLARHMEIEGHTVVLAKDAGPGLETFRQHKVDLVLTDLSMPRMGGLALCQNIRSRSNVPIIVLSVKNQETIKIQALESGRFYGIPMGCGKIREGENLLGRLKPDELSRFVLCLEVWEGENLLGRLKPWY